MEHDSLKLTEFDKLTGSYSLQMLKAALTYFPPAWKRHLSVLIKMQELQNTMNLFSDSGQESVLNICSVPENAPKRGFFDVLQEIMEYGSPEQKQAFNRMNTIIQLASMYEQMPPSNSPASAEKKDSAKDAEPISGEEEFLSAADLDSKGSSSDFGSYVRSTLTKEQQALFDSYSAMFHFPDSFTRKDS